MNAFLHRLLCGGIWLAASGFCMGQTQPPADSSPVHVVTLLPNGDFEQADPADPTKPLHWDQPDGLGVQWIDAPQIANQPPHGKAIRFNTAISEEDMARQWTKKGITQWLIPKPAKNPVAETYGLSFYSDAIAIKPDQAYRITFDFMSSGTVGKAWVRAFGQVDGQKRRLYETIVNCKKKGDGWKEFSQIFHPTKHAPNVTEMKVMLYAYYPPGICWFDNIRIEPVENH